MSSFANGAWLVLGCGGPSLGGSFGLLDTLLVLVFLALFLLFNPLTLGLIIPIVFVRWWIKGDLGRAWASTFGARVHRIKLALKLALERRKAARSLVPCTGAVWAQGERPNCTQLDGATRIAVEAWWLAEARRAHGAVACLARTQWLLTAAGAPVELVVATQRAGEVKVGHAQTCFALAAGYGRRTLPVEPRPDLLRVRLGGRKDLIAALVSEVVESGCLFSAFSADAAEARVRGCSEPIARETLESVARHDHSHAELSWVVLRWLAQTAPAPTRRVLAGVRRGLPFAARPPLMPKVTEKWLSKTTQGAALALGVLPGASLRAIWEERAAQTRAAVDALLAAEPLKSAKRSAPRHAEPGGAAAGLRLQ